MRYLNSFLRLPEILESRLRTSYILRSMDTRIADALQLSPAQPQAPELFENC